MKLCAVYLGGRHLKSNIELHDVIFVVGSTLEETYPRIKEKWFGYPDKIPHIDSWIDLTHANGYEITLTTKKPVDQDLKLFFVNFGAYTAHQFGEVHESAFYVAPSKALATRKAEKELCVGLIQCHLDDNLVVDQLVETEFGKFEVDDVLEIDQVDGYFLSFAPSPLQGTPKANPGYIRLKLEPISCSS